MRYVLMVDVFYFITFSSSYFHASGYLCVICVLVVKDGGIVKGKCLEN